MNIILPSRRLKYFIIIWTPNRENKMIKVISSDMDGTNYALSEKTIQSIKK